MGCMHPKPISSSLAQYALATNTKIRRKYINAYHKHGENNTTGKRLDGRRENVQPRKHKEMRHTSITSTSITVCG